MVKPKAAAKRHAPPHDRRSKAVLTTAFMVDTGGAFPKGAALLTFTAPNDAVKVLAGEPAKVRPLLQRYGEAVARSHEAGRSVSFRVDVGPDGDATVTPIQEAVAVTDPVSIETIEERDPELVKALVEARERGRERAAEILARDDMLSAKAFAVMLGTTRMTVNTKRQNGQLLGLDGARRGFRFPVWQLDADGKPYAELPMLLEVLGAPWAVYRFLVQQHGSLGNLSGRDALERKRGPDVISAAEGIARGDFT
jgi:hypothetical protein